MKLKYAPHYCYEWDGLPIMPWHIEASICICQTSIIEFFRHWYYGLKHFKEFNFQDFRRH